jgi:plastocyanin
VDPATAGSLTGTATLEGTAPDQQAIQMGADPVCARLHPTPVRTEFVVANENGTLANVFVYVKGGLEGRSFPTPSEAVLLDQQGCTYHPHIFGIMVGQNLDIRNSDDTLHNIHAMPVNNEQFNIGQPVKGLTTTRTFQNAEVMVPFKCDVHKWMNSYAGVLPHPYYSVTADTGSFEIGNLPPGDYVVEAWHETLGAQTQSVTVGASETKEVSFTFSAE